jgi:hypothetical protein
MAEDVFRLEVAMEISIFMQTSKSGCNFKEDSLYLMLR